MKNLPQIKVTFLLISDEDYTQIITDTLGIVPSRVRKKDSFRIKEFACTSWELTTGKEKSRAIEYQFIKILDQLKGKEAKIKELMGKYNIESDFVVVIHAKSTDGPEVNLPKEVISFAAKIKAEIGFDLYYY